MSGMVTLKSTPFLDVQRIPAGYKKADVGTIPEDWQQHQLRDITTKIGSGVTPTGGINRYKATGRPFVRSQNVGWGDLLLADLCFIDDSTHYEFPATELKKGDVLLNITGASIGRSSVADERLIGGNVNQHVCIVRTDPKKAHPNLVNLVLLSALGQKQIESFQAGGNRQGLNFVQVGSIKIPLPPTLDEQQAIAEALSDASALIEGLESLIAKKRAIKQGAMQDLLTGKRRLPGFKGEWELKRLGEIGESLIGLTYSPLDVRESGTLVLRSSNIQEGALRFDDNVFVERDVPERIRVQNGDILICVRNGSRDLIGKCAKIDARCAGMTFGAFMAVFRTPSHDFVFHQFKSDGIKRQIQEHLGATINQITNKSLNSFVIRIPPNLAEQRAVAGVLSDMDAEIEALDGKLAKARAVKKGMMQELLTGRVRLV